jgi:hypothetical protein
LAERNGDFNDVCPAVANGESAGFSRVKYPDCPDALLAEQVGAPRTFLSNQMTYPGNTGPRGGDVFLNQNALAILNTGIIPLPNATSGCNSTGSACYLGDVSLPTYWREELFRIDHILTSKLQAGFHYIHDEWDQTTPVPQYAYTQNSLPTIQNRFYAPGLSLAARLSGAFSPSFLNEFVVSYTDSHITLQNVPAPGVTLARPSTLDEPCAADSVQCGMTTIFSNGSAGTDGVPKSPGVAIAGNNGEFGGFGFSLDPGYMPWEHSNPTYSFADNLTKTLRTHNFQFGAQWLIFQRNQINGPIGAATGDAQGLLTFSDIPANGSTGNAFADFLYTAYVSNASPPGGDGAISIFQQDSGQARYHQRYQIVEPYFQDANGSGLPVEGDFVIGSADWMHRNLSKRIEVATPIHAPAKKKLWEILDICLRDRRQAWALDADGRYTQLRPEGDGNGPETVGTHQALMQLTTERFDQE